jgi:hypothetical protein
MKYLFFIVLLVAIILSAGCTHIASDSKPDPITNPPSTAMTINPTITFTPISTPALPNDPIIGSWYCYNYLPSGKIEKLWTFMENNTFTMINTNIKSQHKKYVNGVWIKESATIYQVTPTGGSGDMFTYDSSKDEFSDTYFGDTYTHITEGK